MAVLYQLERITRTQICCFVKTCVDKFRRAKIEPGKWKLVRESQREWGMAKANRWADVN